MAPGDWLCGGAPVQDLPPENPLEVGEAGGTGGGGAGQELSGQGG